MSPKTFLARFGEAALINLSYGDKARSDALIELTGRRFNFFQSIKLGGTGSPKLRLYSGPKELERHVLQTSALPSCNIELRESGIVIRFRIRQEVIALAMPYSAVIRSLFVVGSPIEEIAGRIRIDLRNGDTVELGAVPSVRDSASHFADKLNRRVQSGG